MGRGMIGCFASREWDDMDLNKYMEVGFINTRGIHDVWLNINISFTWISFVVGLIRFVKINLLNIYLYVQCSI